MFKSVSSLRMALRFIDIGVNLADPMFRGIYGGSQKHQDDLEMVLGRAWKQGMERMVITVGTLNEADEALSLSRKDERLFVTMGCHPTRCGEFLPHPDDYYEHLRSEIASNRNKVIAVGECGLDYDRLHFCDKETQKTYFERQLSLAAEFRLPLFLHCRSAHQDLMEILERNRSKLEACGGGVIHSFDGTGEEARKILDFTPNLYIGLNGCSLKTSENLAVIHELPNERLLLETDSPWCSIRPSHAGHKYIQTKFPTVKKKDKWTPDSLIDGRNEPCQIRQVLEVVAGVKEQPLVKLANTFYENTMKLFFSETRI